MPKRTISADWQEAHRGGAESKVGEGEACKLSH